MVPEAGAPYFGGALALPTTAGGKTHQLFPAAGTLLPNSGAVHGKVASRGQEPAMASAGSLHTGGPFFNLYFPPSFFSTLLRPRQVLVASQWMWESPSFCPAPSGKKTCCSAFL